MHDHILEDGLGLNLKGGKYWNKIWQCYSVPNVKHVSKGCSASIFKVS